MKSAVKKYLLGTLFVFAGSIAHAGYFTSTRAFLKDFNLNQLNYVSTYNVGLLENSGCPGTLVTHTLVVTAAHCLVDKDNKFLSSDKINFIFVTKGEVKQSRGKNIIFESPDLIPPEKKSDWGQNLKYHQLDIAVLELQQPIEGGRKIQIGNPLSNYTNQLVTVGFPVVPGTERAQVLTAKCRIKSVYHNNVMNSDCPASPGSSGGPMLLADRGSLYLLGIIMGMKINNTPEDKVEYSDETATYGIAFFSESRIASFLRERVGN